MTTSRSILFAVLFAMVVTTAAFIIAGFTTSWFAGWYNSANVAVRFVKYVAVVGLVTLFVVVVVDG